MEEADSRIWSQIQWVTEATEMNDPESDQQFGSVRRLGPLERGLLMPSESDV